MVAASTHFVEKKRYKTCLWTPSYPSIPPSIRAGTFIQTNSRFSFPVEGSPQTLSVSHSMMDPVLGGWFARGAFKRPPVRGWHSVYLLGLVITFLGIIAAWSQSNPSFFLLPLYFTVLWDFSGWSAWNPSNRSRRKPRVHVRVCMCVPQTTSAQSQESPRPVREPILTASEKLQVQLFGKYSTAKHWEPGERDGLLHQLTLIRGCWCRWLRYVAVSIQLQSSVRNSSPEINLGILISRFWHFNMI